MVLRAIATKSTSTIQSPRAKLFRGFADPSRLSILEALRGAPLTVGDIVSTTGLSQSNASNHLACLLECGLVSRKKHGKFVIYDLADTRVETLLTIADEVIIEIAQNILDCTQFRDAEGKNQ